MSVLKGLDLNLLIVFEAVYSSGNISQAAKSLGMSQPTISNALGRLRETLDDPLFVREGRGVKPTTKAVTMIGPIREALQMIEGGVSGDEGFDPTTSRRHFRIVAMDSIEAFIAPYLIKLVQDFQSVTIENLPIISTSMVDGLHDGLLDVVLANFLNDSQDCTCLPLLTPALSMIARKDHPKIDGAFTLEHFQRLSHIALVPKLRALSRLEEGLRAQNITRHIVYSVTKFWAFPHIVATTDLVGIVPTAFAHETAKTYPLAIYPLPFEYPSEKLYMTWKTSRTNDPGHRWLREEIIKVLTPPGATPALPLVGGRQPVPAENV
jgi:DNA-binding transcriptional LysR family regulator